MLSIVVRIFCKFYECILRAYTFTFRVFGPRGSDPSRILVDHLTPLQVQLQSKFKGRHPEARPRHPEAQPKDLEQVLIVVPFRDRWDLTKTCLESLAQQVIPDGLRMRTILVDNRSVEAETRSQLAKSVTQWPNLKIEILNADYEFNYSQLNNDAVRKYATLETKWVLFLNNDVELVDHSILSRMVEALSVNSDVGVVGCTLLYPDRSVQHLFAAPGVKIVAAHPLKQTRLPQENAWFQQPLRVVPAVTGAVMLVRAKDFNAIGMFDETLPTLGQDIDLCLNIFTKLGLVPAVVTSTVVIHHESKTKKSGFARPEIELMYKKWGSKIFDSALYSGRFSRWSERPVFQPFGSEPRYPWRLII